MPPRLGRKSLGTARRWGIEEWHRTLKSVCQVEQREFKTARHLERVLAFDLILAWRILALLKLGRVLPQAPASLILHAGRNRGAHAWSKKTPRPPNSPCKKPIT